MVDIVVERSSPVLTKVINIDNMQLFLRIGYLLNNIFSKTKNKNSLV